jgi:hypothetical protein
VLPFQSLAVLVGLAVAVSADGFGGELKILMTSGFFFTLILAPW